MHTTIKLFASVSLACAALACSAETSSTNDGAAQADTTVLRENGKTSIRFGADEVIATDDGDQRSVAYFQAGTWVGSVAYRRADRHLAISAPGGFARSGTLPFELGAGVRDAKNAAAVMAALDLTEQDRARYLGALASTDAHLASANLVRAFAQHRAAAGGLEPQMWGVCTNEAEAVACGFLTLGLCGYAMILDCL